MSKKLLYVLGAIVAGLFVAGGISYASYIGSLGAGLVLSSSTPNAYSVLATPLAATYGGTATTTALGTNAFNSTAFLTTSTGLTASNFAANTVPTIATTTKVMIDVTPSTTDDYAFELHSPAAFTVKEADCLNDPVAGNTFTFNIYWGTTNTATNKVFSSDQTCSNNSTTSVLTSFASSTISAGSIIYLHLASQSTTAGYIEYQF